MNVDLKYAIIGQLTEQNILLKAKIDDLQGVVEALQNQNADVKADLQVALDRADFAEGHARIYEPEMKVVLPADVE